MFIVVDGDNDDDDGGGGDDDDDDDVSFDDDVDQISIVANLSLRFQLIGRAGLSNSTLIIRYIHMFTLVNIYVNSYPI